MPRRLPVNIAAERARMADAAWVRCAARMEWKRLEGTTFHTSGAMASLDGEGGQLLRRCIQAKFAPGPRARVTNQEGVEIETGYSYRWALIEALIDPSTHPVQRIANEMALLYRSGLGVSGDISSPAWSWLEERSGVDRAMRRKQSDTLLLGSCVVRPTMRPFGQGQYYPPSLTVVPPDRCIAIEDPSRPGQCAVYLEQMKNGRSTPWMVIDVSDPSAPSFGFYTSPESWERGESAIWEVVGAAYPWWWQGEPLMPAVVSTFRQGDELLPNIRPDMQSAIDRMLERAWIDVCKHVTGFSRAFLMAKSDVDGLAQTMIDPAVLGVLQSAGDMTMEIIPDGTAAVSTQMEMFRARMLEWSQRYDTGFQIEESTSAQSGRALLVRLAGKEGVRNQMVTDARPVDEHAIKALVATHNYLVRSGQMSLRLVGEQIKWTPNLPPVLSADLLIPEGDIRLDYPHFWYSSEKREIRDEMVKAADAGYRDHREIWLFDRDLENDGPDGPNWQAATDAIASNLNYAMQLAAQGFGLDAKTRYVIASRTPEDEAQMHIPTPDVATTASRGLMLRKEFPGRAAGLAGIGTSEKDLRARARMLADQTPMTSGAVRELSAWLAAHASDKDKLNVDATGNLLPGEWGNDQDPSGPYITWLSQGGEPAVGWCEIELAPKPVATPAPAPAPDPANNEVINAA